MLSQLRIATWNSQSVRQPISEHFILETSLTPWVRNRQLSRLQHICSRAGRIMDMASALVQCFRQCCESERILLSLCLWALFPAMLRGWKGNRICMFDLQWQLWVLIGATVRAGTHSSVVLRDIWSLYLHTSFNLHCFLVGRFNCLQISWTAKSYDIKSNTCFVGYSVSISACVHSRCTLCVAHTPLLFFPDKPATNARLVVLPGQQGVGVPFRQTITILAFFLEDVSLQLSKTRSLNTKTSLVLR